jgi:hypothetical protein
VSAFTVEVKNQPGELLHLCETMAARQINLILCGTSHGDRGTIAFIVDDEAAARAALDRAGIEFTERPAVTVRMENLPGTGAATLRKLTDADVNVDLLLPVHISDEQFYAVICVDDVHAARIALGDQIIND